MLEEENPQPDVTHAADDQAGSGSPEKAVEVVRQEDAGSEAKVPTTRAGRLWIGVLPVILLLGVLLDFVLQNLRSAKVTFLGFSGSFPLSVLVLVSAAVGGLLILLLGSIRILQLRRLVKRRRTSR